MSLLTATFPTATAPPPHYSGECRFDAETQEDVIIYAAISMDVEMCEQLLNRGYTIRWESSRFGPECVARWLISTNRFGILKLFIRHHVITAHDANILDFLEDANDKERKCITLLWEQFDCSGAATKSARS